VGPRVTPHAAPERAGAGGPLRPPAGGEGSGRGRTGDEPARAGQGGGRTRGPSPPQMIRRSGLVGAGRASEVPAPAGVVAVGGPGARPAAERPAGLDRATAGRMGTGAPGDEFRGRRHASREAGLQGGRRRRHGRPVRPAVPGAGSRLAAALVDPRQLDRGSTPRRSGRHGRRSLWKDTLSRLPPPGPCPSPGAAAGAVRAEARSLLASWQQPCSRWSALPASRLVASAAGRPCPGPASAWAASTSESGAGSTGRSATSSTAPARPRPTTSRPRTRSP
jgi:hypothetical protein